MRLFLLLSVLLPLACSQPAAQAPTAEAGTPAAASTSTGPTLRMKVDGREVVCTNVFGAYNPKGYPPGTAIVAGDMKPDGSQPFNIALYDIPNTGEYSITREHDPVKWAVQYIDPTSTDPFGIRHLAVNNQAGEVFRIRFSKLGASDLEGSFEGALTDDNGKHVVRITEGRFDTE